MKFINQLLSSNPKPQSHNSKLITSTGARFQRVTTTRTGSRRLTFIFSLFTFLLILLSPKLSAGEGDTLVVQTIDWDTPVLPGWNSPRSGYYQFPGDTISFSQILMYYTLKCDPLQNPPCGEWDYTTHTRLHEHTGVYDSNLYFHPNYMVNNASPDSFMYMNNESYSYEAWLQYSNQTTPTGEATVGNGGESLIFHVDGVAADGRMQHIYKVAELQAGGLQSGAITGLKYNFGEASITFNHYRIRMMNTDMDTLPPHYIFSEGFTTVFDQNISFETGITEIDFAFPFNWDGTSNILVDVNYEKQTGSAAMEADMVNGKTAKYSIAHDYFLDFEGWDYIDVPAEVFSTIDSAITISLWQYGNPAIQPANSSIIEGVDSAGHRVLNVHLPWGNGRIYWDAGWDGGNDRIDRTAESEDQYMGKWNHWAFTKDLSTGLMLVYLNGELWNIGGGFNRPMGGVTKFRIGANVSVKNYYAGMIDEVRIWDEALDEETIKDWMYKDVTSAHPDYGSLRAYYQFNEGNGFGADDSSPNDFDGTQFGLPGWMDYRGQYRFRNATAMTFRPHLIFENGNYDAATLDSVVMVDTSAKAPVNIVLFDPDDPPTPTDTLTKYPSYYDTYVYDEGANAIDSTLVEPDGIFYYEDYSYYGDPYEIVVPWEIARYITPYGINLTLGEGWTWVFDVTDYAPMLRDTVHITAGNFQELLDLKFYMIEGTPPREVKKIEKVYSGYWNLKDFPEKVQPDTVELIDEATTFKIKTRTSGHRFDNPTNCAEFCYKIHEVVINGESIYEWQIIEECADNPLHPQGGTWIYDRAGWCPGAKVTEHDVEITPYIEGDEVVIDYNSQPDEYGSYVLEVQLFSYGDANFTLDAAVDDVIAPNKLERYGRFNPNASSPIIVIQNRGADTLYSLDIDYGPDGASRTFEWTGELGFMDKEKVVLDYLDWNDWVEGNGKFSVELSNPNSKADEYPRNDKYETKYEMPPVYPGTIVIHFRTNKRPHENYYQVFNNSGDLVFEKDNLEASTLYIDTITLVNDTYAFYLWDSGNDGISFWAHPEAGSGSLKFYDLNEDALNFFNPDFGTHIYHSFYADMYLGRDELAAGKLSFDISPNPTDGHIAITYALQDEAAFRMTIYNATAQEVWNATESGKANGKLYLDLGHLPSGIYTCVMESEGVVVSRKFVKQ